MKLMIQTTLSALQTDLQYEGDGEHGKLIIFQKFSRNFLVKF